MIVIFLVPQGVAFASLTAPGSTRPSASERSTRLHPQTQLPIWNTSLMNDMGELASPTVYNGVMYVINGKWTFVLEDGARRLRNVWTKLRGDAAPH